MEHGIWNMKRGKWNMEWRGTWQIHGHAHGNGWNNTNGMNGMNSAKRVGVDMDMGMDTDMDIYMGTGMDMDLG
eukprot:2532018-Lingulodinium_polyedra.AAC.1